MGRANRLFRPHQPNERSARNRSRCVDARFEPRRECSVRASPWGIGRVGQGDGRCPVAAARVHTTTLAPHPSNVRNSGGVSALLR
jgi:hypothetical protein